MKVTIIGGSGLIGSRLVGELRARGHDVVPASPNTGVNTLTGEGLAGALDGAATVVDVSNAPALVGSAPIEFFEASTRNLVDAEETAGVGHHVVLSIVGTERLVEASYFRGKLAQEKLVKGSPVLFTIVRATQFYEFLPGIADGATDRGIVRLPPVLFQPMAAGDVVAALAGVAVDTPVDGTIEIAGPEPFPLDELVRERLQALDDPRDVITDPDASYFGARVEKRTLLPGPDAVLGATTLADWLSPDAKHPVRDSNP